MHRQITAVLLTALITACDHATPALAPSDVREPDLSEGAQIDRFEIAPFFFADFEHGFVYSIGLVTPNEEGCADPENAVFDGALNIQFVLTPSGRLHEHWVTDRATLVVYGSIPPHPCLLTEADVIGRGTGKLIYHDNDAFAIGNGAFGFHITGIIELVNGGRAHFLATFYRVSVDGERRVVVDKVELKPIGG